MRITVGAQGEGVQSSRCLGFLRFPAKPLGRECEYLEAPAFVEQGEHVPVAHTGGLEVMPGRLARLRLGKRITGITREGLYK